MSVLPFLAAAIVGTVIATLLRGIRRLGTLAGLGAGMDVVSEGELKRARMAGIRADKIMFSGLGKTARELALAVDEGILCINVESEPELELLSSIAAAKGRSACISVRVNPDVDAKTHHKIATGKAKGKIAYNYYAEQLYDPRCSVIQALDASGKPIATLVNYAIHPEVIGSGAGILSPDLVGPLYERLAEKGGGTGIFMNSAQGGMVTADNRLPDRNISDCSSALACC